MATKVFKAVVPQYLGSRQSTRKKSIFIGGAGGPVVAALYARSSSLAVFDTENQKGGTLTIIHGSGELLRLHGERGYLTAAFPGLLAVSFLGNGKQIQIKCNGSFWFFVSRHSIVVVDERKVTKIRLTENLNQVTEYTHNSTGGIDGIKLPRNPAIIQADPKTARVVVGTAIDFQCWNFSKAIARPDGTVSAGSLVYEGHVDGRFGVAILRVHDGTIAAITNSGDMLELWHVRAGQRSSASYIQLLQKIMATCLYLDDQYVILGHVDGTVSVYDRISGKRYSIIKNRELSPAPRRRLETPTAAGADGLLNNQRLLWLDRMGEHIFSASLESLQVRHVDALDSCLTYRLPPGSKLEQAFLDRQTGSLYATVQADSDGEALKACDLILWHPNLKDLQKKPEVNFTTVTENCDISPPREIFASLKIAEWTQMDVVYFLAALGMHEHRRVFYNAEVDGTSLLELDEDALKRLGVSAVGHRKRLLLERARWFECDTDVEIPVGTRPLSSPWNDLTASSASDTEGSTDSTKILPMNPYSNSSSFGSSFSSSESPLFSSIPRSRMRSPSAPHLSLERSTSETFDASALSPSRTSSRNILIPKVSSSPSRARTSIGSAISDSPPRKSLFALSESVGSPLKAGRVKFVCSFEGREGSVCVRMNSTNIALQDLQERVSEALMLDGIIKKGTTFSLHATAPDLGDVTLAEQDALDDMIAESILKKLSRVQLLAVPTSPLASSPSSTETSPLDSEVLSLSLPSARELVSKNKKPCFLVHGENFQIFEVNPLAQKSTGYSTTELLHKNFDNTMVFQSPDFKLGSHIPRLDWDTGGEVFPPSESTIEFQSVLQNKDGTLQSCKLSARPLEVDGTKMLELCVEPL